MKTETLKFGDIAYLRKDTVNPKKIEDAKYLGLEHINKESLSINSIGTSNDLNSNKFVFSPDDVLFGKLRPYFRKVYKPKFDGICSTDIWVVRPRDNNTCKDFLFYLMADQKFVDFANQGATGTRMPRADWNHVVEYEVKKFSHEEQTQISKILRSFDDKIELNQQMNETLEEIAKTLFKSWFIDFDPVRAKAEGKPTGLSKEISDLFPDSFENSELGEIPNGWQVLKIDDCCDTTDYVANGSFKTLRDNTNRVDGKEGDAAILIRVTDHNSNWNSEFQYIDDDSYEFLEKTKLFPEDLIICNVGDVGKCFLLPDLGRKMSLGPNGILCKNFDKKELISKEYLFYFLNNANTQNFLRSIATGSVQSKFNKTQFRSLQLVTPGDGLLNSFTGTIKEIFKKKNLIFNENNILSKLRDTLLPKLISGELKIQDAENLAEEAGT